MKLVCTFFFSNILAMAAWGQVTVSGDQYTHANSSNTYEQASPLWTGGAALIAQAGENQVWTLAGWEAANSAVETYVPITQAPSLYQFFFNTPFLYPSNVSTHGLEVAAGDIGAELPIEITDAFAFFRNDANGYYATGNAFSLQGLPIATPNAVVERIYPWPLEYGLEFSGEGSYLTNLLGFGAYGQDSERSGIVDGWGTFEGPYGNFDVLRMRTEIQITDTINIEQLGGGQSIQRPLQVNYTWISPEREGPIMEISLINDQIFSARLMVDGINLRTEENLFEQGLSIYPNPSPDGFQVIWPGIEPLQIQLFDAHGKLVYSGSQTGHYFSRNNLPAGLYLVHFSRNGEALGSKRIVFTE